MPQTNPYQDYLNLANDLFDARISERDLPRTAAQLDLLDEKLLNELVRYAEKASLSEPRRSWAILQVAHEAARSQGDNLWLQSLSAWYLGRACNDWAQPERVTEAIKRARDGFAKLNKSGWISACDWQDNALPWTKASFPQAVQALEDALTGLQNAGLEDFIPLCRLALSYAQILIGKFDKAEENILLCEEVFDSQGDEINRARCWLNEASRLRRLSKSDDAISELEKAKFVFNNKNAFLDVAKADYQLGLNYLVRTDNLAIAISYLEQAARVFGQSGLDLWRATCLTNLGAIHTQYGQLSKAQKLLDEARVSLIKHNILGLLADNLNDSGKLNTLRGSPEIGLNLFKQAEELYEKLGSGLYAAVVAGNIGEAYGRLGRYQDALHHLERAADRLRPYDNTLLKGTCENFTALIWWRLGQLTLAHEHLDRAAENYREAKQVAYLSLVYNFKAGIFFEQGELEKAIDLLNASLEIAKASGARPHAALARRLLGEAFLLSEQYEKAEDHLKHALGDFSEMNMLLERAATLVSLGNYYAQRSDSKRSRNAYREALRLSANSFPEIDWRAYIGQASLAEARANIKAVIRDYRRGEEALSKVRLNFWQPALAGSYLQSPSGVYDRAVTLAVEAASPQDALRFVENNKAITFLRQLSVSNISSGDKKLHELSDLRAEISWLQEQMRASLGQTNLIQSTLRTRLLRTQLTDKVKQYDAQMAYLERQKISGQASAILPLRFDLALIRKLINRVLGKAWVALDYYLTEDQLIIVVLTQKLCQLYSSPMSNRFMLALEECLKARRNATSPLQSDLTVIGDFLIPPFVANLLSPNTYLLLAPHRKFHGLPWGAIQPTVISQPLACVCTPNVIPSLHSFALLCERYLSRSISSRDHGLIIGVSKFRGAHPELPLVNDEIDTLKGKLGSGGHLLRDSEASWENIHGLAHSGDSSHPSEGLLRFDWLHIASHVFPDVHTGRLSGIALWDGDIWLDQLRDLAPLPTLVTFSACNSIFSMIYQGDEHVGLPTTCLIAGADSIIGSVWPIQDHQVAEFMASFYDQYLDGKRPAKAMVHTQRQMIARGEDITNWASFVCVGVP